MRLFYTLADYPHDMVEIECAKCGRRGRRRTERLIEEYGPDMKLRRNIRKRCIPTWRATSA
jgi:hypothetical protein